MPSVIRKTVSSLVEGRREILHAVTWRQVGSNVWSPPTDAYETDKAYIVRVEIAGMREKEFEVAFEENILSITGYRSDIPDRRAFHQMEIRYGKFASAVAVPVSVDVDSATAEYSDGFLTVTLPKIKSDQG